MQNLQNVAVFMVKLMVYVIRQAGYVISWIANEDSSLAIRSDSVSPSYTSFISRKHATLKARRGNQCMMEWELIGFSAG